MNMHGTTHGLEPHPNQPHKAISCFAFSKLADFEGLYHISPKSTAAGYCVKMVSLLCRSYFAAVTPWTQAAQARKRCDRAAKPF